MKISKAQAEENRERIVEEAARLFRERGYDGIGVADLMKSAGFTHGGFYGHFGSKEALAAETCAHSMSRTVGGLGGLIESNPDDPLKAVVSSYLSTQHRDALGSGCLLPALSADVGRQGPAVREVFTAGLRSFFDTLTRVVPGRSRSAQRRRSIATMAMLVGAVTLARAVDDPALSDEILRATRATLG